MAMPLIVGQEWRRRISRMQWLLNAVLAVECLSMPFFAAERLNLLANGADGLRQLVRADVRLCVK